MVKHSAWRKNNLREIRHTMGRFLAIMAIVALGVGFLAGLKLTKPAMMQIGCEFIEDYNLYDFQLLGTLGLTEDDVQAFRDREDIAVAEGSVSGDLVTTVQNRQRVFKTHQLLQDLNQIQLTAGRMPQAPNECLGDDLFFKEDMLGMELPMENKDDEFFSQDSYTLVGIGNTPQYLNFQRGTTSLADGTVAGFLFLPPEGYDAEVFTELYLGIAGDYEPYSEAYKDRVAQLQEPLEDFLEERGQLRRENVIAEAREELDDGWAEYEDGLQDYEEGKQEADQELADARQELQDADQDLQEAKEKLADAKDELADGQQQILDAEQELRDGEAELAELQKDPLSNEDIAKARQELDDGWAEYNDGLAELEENRKTFEEKKPDAEKELALAEQQLEDAEFQLKAGRAQLQQLEQAGMPPQMLEPLRQQLAAGEAQLEAGRKQYDQGVTELKRAEKLLYYAGLQLEDAKMKLENGEQELKTSYEDALKEAREKLDEGWAELRDAKADYEDGVKEYEDGVKEYEDGLQDYADGQKDYEEGKLEAEEELADAELELADARIDLEDAEQELRDLEENKTYVLDRMTNAGYASFDNDTSIVDGIAKIFPIFFFLVAALVCSSTMTRMVEEQRTQNGTLKAMGYSDGMILWRYAAYAGSAALLGCAIGYFLCAWLFPAVIWHAYQVIYHFGEIRLLLDGKLALVCVVFSLVCSVGAACAAAWSEMRQMPAQLMRPKAPKAGKRIWLEHITPLWKRMNFLHKVTARNIFRYKKRLFMMMLGVGGCMALLLAGLGLRDSVVNVANDQFTRITVYDYAATFDEGQTPEQQEAFREAMGDDLRDSVFLDMQAVDAFTEQGLKSVSVLATSDPEVTSLLHLHDGETDLGYPSDDGVFINNKLAKLAEVKVGDTIKVQLKNHDQVILPIEGIYENYVNHYIIMTEAGYEKFFQTEPVYQTLYATTDSEDLYGVSAKLQNQDGVVSVSVSQQFRGMIADTLTSMNAVIALVVACAVALSFVVGYNLSNINITERAREIATIKVLGFYPKETYSYVLRESLVLTVFGAFVGIPLGAWLHRFVLAQIQVDIISFHPRISWLSFILAVVITLSITEIVGLILRKKIDKINMAESLKSVE